MNLDRPALGTDEVSRQAEDAERWPTFDEALRQGREEGRLAAEEVGMLDFGATIDEDWLQETIELDRLQEEEKKKLAYKKPWNEIACRKRRKRLGSLQAGSGRVKIRDNCAAWSLRLRLASARASRTSSLSRNNYRELVA